MTEVVKLDAVGMPIEMGATYGYSVHTSGVGKVTIGKAAVVQATSAPSRSTTSAHPRVLVAFASGPSSQT